jgi:hypothetical protein
MRDTFRICKKSRYEGRLTGSVGRSIILSFGKTLELENDIDNGIIILSTKMIDETV